MSHYTLDLSRLNEVGQPPITNRGVQNTLAHFPQDFIQTEGIILDWVSATFDYSPEIFGFLRDWLGEFNDRDRGLQGYTHSATILGTGAVCWSPDRTDQGIHIRLPASALAIIQGESVDVLRRVIDKGGRFRRLDIALDDFAGDLDLELIVHHLANGLLTTRWTTYEEIRGKVDIGTVQTCGRTVYIGSRRSESFLRFYDKRAEQYTKAKNRLRGGLTDEEKAQGLQEIENDLPDHWVRCELESKGDRANVLGRALVDAHDKGKLAETFSEYLLGFIDFKETGAADTNKSRWATVGWWADFLLTTVKRRLTLPKPIQTLETVKAWFDVSIAPMASVIMATMSAEGEAGYDWLMGSIVGGWSRLKEHHKAILQGAGVPLEQIDLAFA